MTASFYQNHVFCCKNLRPEGHPSGCCQEKGGVSLQNYMKVRAKELGIAKTRINKAGCLDRCALGPVMVIYPEGVWYHYATREDVDEILESHLIGGTIVERLRLDNDQTGLTPAQAETLACAVTCREKSGGEKSV